MADQAGMEAGEVLRLESVDVTLSGRRILDQVTFALHAG